MEMAKKEVNAQKETEEVKTDLPDQEMGKQQYDPELRIQELTVLLQRLQADFDNFRRRAEKNTLDSIQRGTIDVVSKLLPILDSFEMALKNNLMQDEFSKGIHLIYIQLLDLFKTLGLKPIASINVPFDPYKHEALLRATTNDFPENTVVEIFQKGYLLHDYVLRYAKVKVSVRGNETTNSK